MKGFNSFGVMLDMSRNGVMKIDALKRYADIIKKMGYDSLGLYTEDTFKVEGEPHFGYMRGAYTESEIKELDAYCKKIGITLFPCIQTLAHLNALFRYTEYLEIQDNTDILMIDDERTYVLIENMFKSLRKMYSTDRVNIGMDEAHLVGLGRYVDRYGYKDRSELLLKHLKRVADIAKKYGFVPEMWSDMFFRLVSGGVYYKKINPKDAERVKSLIPDDVKLSYWDYYGTDRKHYKSMIQSHKLLTDKITFAGGVWSWSGHAPNNTFAIKTIKASMPEIIEGGIKDYYLTVWGDDGKECSYFSALPSLMFAAEYAKGNHDLKDIKQKFFNIVGVSYDDFMKLDLLNKIPTDIKLVGFENISKIGLYNDLFIGFYDGTVLDGGKERYKKYYRMLKNAMKRAGEFAYIFEKMTAFSKVMYYKYDLGVETEKAYKQKDKEKLNDLLKDYKKLVIALKDFYNKFEYEWNLECKPYGFEVQDIRLGGLTRRVEHCAKRLKDFIDGKVCKIDELEEIRNYQNKIPTCFNSWAYLASPSVMSHCSIIPLL